MLCRSAAAPVLRRLAAAPQPYDVATAMRSTSELGKLRMWVWLELQSTPTLMDDDIDRLLTVEPGSVSARIQYRARFGRGKLISGHNFGNLSIGR
jgi:hypothetical protein